MSQTEQSALQRVNWPVALLAVGLFLAPLIGGRVPTDALPVAPGYTETLRAALRTGELPLLAHTLIAVPIVVALLWGLFARRVVQIPFSRIGVPAMILGIAITFSIFVSQFPALSWPAWASWMIYLVAFAAGVSGVGREKGPIAVMGALVAGVGLTSLLAILEYREVSDPAWRVFGTWMNPNALAGILVLGLFVAVGLALTAPRLGAILSGLSAALCGVALLLTQSRGGFLAALAGLVVLALVLLIWVRPLPRLGAQLAKVAVIGGVTGLLFFGLVSSRTSSTAAGGTAMMSRVANPEATREQSQGFRTLLWRSAIQLMRQSPAGTGIGTYRFASSRPGLTPQTVMAHQSFLQLGSEAGVVALLALVGLGLVWVREVFRGSAKLPSEQNLLRGAILAAIAASAAHSMVDSDLQHFGIGVAFFALLGIGLSLSADALTPEQAPTWARGSVAAVSVTALAVLAFFGLHEASKSNLVYALMNRSPEAPEMADGLVGNAPFDGEAWSLAAGAARSASEQRERLKKAVETAPSPRNLRALARAQIQDGEIRAAEQTLSRVLDVDPMNLLALYQLMGLPSESPEEEARRVKVAERLVAVEQSPVYQVRAIPELVPTQTYWGRLFLAERRPTSQERIELLEPALAGFIRYRETTLPLVLSALDANAPNGYAGERRDQAELAMQGGLRVAERLVEAYRSAGNAGKANEAASEATRFASSLAELAARNK